MYGQLGQLELCRTILFILREVRSSNHKKTAQQEVLSFI
jgi:hypothetical protein